MELQRILFIVLTCFGDMMGAIVDNPDDLQLLKNRNKQDWILVISPLPEPDPKVLIKRTDETLNLTCRMQRSETSFINGSNIHLSDQQFKLAWYVPNSLENSKNRVINNEYRNSLELIIQNLRDSDTGEYKCTAHEATDNPDTLPFSGSLNVQVKPKKGMTGKINPCDKLEFNCSAQIISPCCNQLQSIQLSLDVSQYSPQPQHYNEIGYLQTTIYTVIGCAMAFMFIITIMVIAICRVHLKRTALSRYPPLPHSNGLRQEPDSWGNVFLQSAPPGAGLLVAYNINNGLHFMGRPVNPPPYSEAVRAMPNEGPPPPYSSRDNLNVAPSLNGQIVLTFENDVVDEGPNGCEDEPDTLAPLLGESLQVTGDNREV